MIHCGDCLDVMKVYPDNHFTNILTDPPYGLSFMNKAWDNSVPDKRYWVEALRICKPGAIMLCFGGTRTYHRLACAIEDAGWEIRDCLMWIYGSGFPKSHNHFGFDGYGTALKPAYEPIILAMKPLDGTFAQNAEKWGVAGINIDDCRIGTDDTRAPTYKMTSKDIQGGGFGSNAMNYSRKGIAGSSCGRWPANTLFDEQAAEMLDKQSGILKSGKLNPILTKKSNAIYGTYNKANINEFKASQGGASRFFYCAKASSAERNNGCEGLPLKKKPSMGEFKQNAGRTALKSGNVLRTNHHPTVKPIALLEYLLKLITPPQNALVLDPFAGSGSTCVAAKNLGIECEGIEISEDYCEIARKRLTQTMV